MSLADDPAFAALPSHLKRSIDDAFDAAVSPHKRHKPAQAAPSEPGGFLVGDVPAGGFMPDAGAQDTVPDAGGFLRDETHTSDVDEETSALMHIPLSAIPTALQILDLQPDDEDVLAVFENASTGWGDRARADDQDTLVSRKDWRAVCAALLDSGPTGTDMAPSEDMVHAQGYVQDLEDLSELSADSAEDYVDCEGTDADSDGSDDEYEESRFDSPKKTRGRSGAVVEGTGSQSLKGRRQRTRQSSPPSSEESGEDEEPTRLSSRQKSECRTAFGLFFPDVADKDVDRQRLGLKDIARAAKLLKEKMTAEEMVEMVEGFSTAADKSMGLGEFERMMVAAKMV